MRILIIADEVWNDELHGNNVLSNWFDGYNADFAEIYCSPGTPNNQCCENYFQITDTMMVKSFLGKKAGNRFELSTSKMQKIAKTEIAEQMPGAFYKFMKSIASTPVLMIRDLIWLTGSYNKKELEKFIVDFEPDVVFCPRLLTPKLIRLEKIVSKYTKAPFIAFTADDEGSLLQVSYSPFFWIRRLLFRKAFKKHIKLYKEYVMFSEEQAIEYAIEYNIATSTLFKSGNFTGAPITKKINTPIQLVYAGRMYCNRWKTLAAIGKALKEINADGIKMTLAIYTQENISNRQLKALLPNDYIRLNGRISPSELIDIYKQADIALHVESFDKKYRYATRVSFSTKIIDLMNSSCAILAICWNKHSGYQYLKKHDAAFCVSEIDNIKALLIQLVDKPELVQAYAKKAWECGEMNHKSIHIQEKMKKILQRVIDEKNNKS